MKSVAWVAAVAIAAILQACTGLLRDASGSATIDAALLLALAACAWQGPVTGLVAAVVGGLLVGAAGGLGVATALLYTMAAAVTVRVSGQNGWLLIPVCAAIPPLLVASAHASALHLGLAALLAVVPAAMHDAAVALLIPILRPRPGL